MKKKYYLMNKNVRLLEFNIEKTLLGEKAVETESFSSLRPAGFSDINTWLNARNYAKHKAHFQKWLAEWGIDSMEGFAEITHALGINDCLWVKNSESGLSWENVNLYNNDFSDIAQTTAFESGLYGLQLSSTDILSPEFTSEGTAPKCWKREDENIYLYKAALSGAANYGLEANSEYIASHISAQIAPQDTVNYELVMFKGKLCSKCQLFTNENIGYVPFYKYLSYTNKCYTMDDVLAICCEAGYENEFRQMILVDSLIFNQDRHMGNFGFLVDNETLEIKGFAPLFDFNISMLCNAMESDICSIDSFLQYEQNYMVGHKLGGKFLEIGKAILTPELREKIPKDIILPKHLLYNLDDIRMTHIADIFNYNLNEIMGSKIYQVNWDFSEIKKRRNEIFTGRDDKLLSYAYGK